MAESQPPSITVSGEYDLATADDLYEIATGGDLSQELVLDASQVTFVDSVALSALVRADSRRRAAGGSLILILPSSGPVARITQVTGLDKVLTIRSADAADDV